MNQTRLDKTNTKIEIKARSKEVYSLVSSYNKMVEMLDESVEELSKSNKEQAWREMAKQVAHEIKNPLTPMKLSVQSFQKGFDINDQNVHDKLDEFIQTLISPFFFRELLTSKPVNVTILENFFFFAVFTALSIFFDSPLEEININKSFLFPYF